MAISIKYGQLSEHPRQGALVVGFLEISLAVEQREVEDVGPVAAFDDSVILRVRMIIVDRPAPIYRDRYLVYL